MNASSLLLKPSARLTYIVQEVIPIAFTCPMPCAINLQIARENGGGIGIGFRGAPTHFGTGSFVNFDKTRAGIDYRL